MTVEFCADADSKRVTLRVLGAVSDDVLRVEVSLPDRGPQSEDDLDLVLRSWSRHLRGLRMLLAEGGRSAREVRGGREVLVWTGVVVSEQ